MFLQPFFNQQQEFITISGEQASGFAKNIADDFNPIHDEDAKRFCVPGDLLFALVLNQYGLSQSMHFQFDGMVGKDVLLKLPENPGPEFSVIDNKDKVYLGVKRDGDVQRSAQVIEQFVRSYVSFSGHNFIDIILPLMKHHQVMINPARPLVIYESMSFHLDKLDIQDLKLELANSDLQVSGKRGDVTLSFNLFDGQTQIGTGQKALILSGLREYEEEAVQGMVDYYQERKLQHKTN